MKPATVSTAYFSATYTTRKIVRAIAAETGLPAGGEYDLSADVAETALGPNGLLVVGVPVYAGRVPEIAAGRLKRLRGDGTPAIAVVAYGNRDYDDALIELTDILRQSGFRVVSAGAFVARHSVFMQVAAGRPDDEDMQAIRSFTDKAMEIVAGIEDGVFPNEITVRGNRPYRQPGSVPLKPAGNRKCNGCGTCVRLCPTGAIPAESPRKTDRERCISCGRCIVVCPRSARRYSGLLYLLAGRKFAKANSVRRLPETFHTK